MTVVREAVPVILPAAKRMLLSGDHAVAYGALLSRARLIPVYPITPQTPILDKISELVAGGMFQADVMTVESEHSPMSAAMVGCLGGVRVFTATASQGLFYMHEVLHFASSGRVPVVMVEVNRSHVPRVAVIDRDLSPGLGGIIAQEVRASLQGVPGAPPVHSFVTGLGGCNIGVEDVKNIARLALDEAEPSVYGTYYKCSGAKSRG